MSTIDKRIAAVRTLEGFGFTFAGGEWKAPDGTPQSFIPSADAMHGLLMRRADALAGYAEGSAKELELEAIADALEAYEIVRWPRARSQPGRADAPTLSSAS